MLKQYWLYELYIMTDCGIISSIFIARADDCFISELAGIYFTVLFDLILVYFRIWVTEVLGNYKTSIDIDAANLLNGLNNIRSRNGHDTIYRMGCDLQKRNDTGRCVWITNLVWQVGCAKHLMHIYVNLNADDVSMSSVYIV